GRQNLERPQHRHASFDLQILPSRGVANERRALSSTGNLSTWRRPPSPLTKRANCCEIISTEKSREICGAACSFFASSATISQSRLQGMADWVCKEWLIG